MEIKYEKSSDISTTVIKKEPLSSDDALQKKQKVKNIKVEVDDDEQPSTSSSVSESVANILKIFQKGNKAKIGASFVKIENEKNVGANVDVAKAIDIKTNKLMLPKIEQSESVEDQIEPIQNTTEVKIRKSSDKNTKIKAGPSKQLKWAPKDWEKTLENLRIMRSDRAAPVDSMGCHKCTDDNADEKVFFCILVWFLINGYTNKYRIFSSWQTQRFHHLIALMLSSQTKDQTTYAAMNRLKSKNLTPQTMVSMDTVELEKLLYPVSFYKTKAKNIQKSSQMLIDQYDSDIPPTLDEMLKLPGVGPKMAHLCMKTAWNVLSGIGIVFVIITSIFILL